MSKVMKITHTPGPWQAGTVSDNSFSYIWDDSETIEVATVQAYDLSPEELAVARANAVLIAAAPDLLDALESATELIAMHYSDKAVVKHYRSIIAMAKNEGEGPPRAKPRK